MTKVYVLWFSGTDDQHYRGIFSTREKAEEALSRVPGSHADLDIDEVDLDVSLY